MTTFDEAYDAAASWLDERGLLLNSQLLQLAAGDETLRNEVREALLSEGVARDRYGVGLVRGEQPIRRLASPRDLDDEESAEITFAEAVTSQETNDLSRGESTQTSDSSLKESVAVDWWLMASGVTRGPFAFEALQRMRQRGEIADMYLVRQGERGLWRSPHDVEGWAEVSKESPSERLLEPVAVMSRTVRNELPVVPTPTEFGRPLRPVSQTQRTESERRLHEVERQRGSNGGTVSRRTASRTVEPSRDKVSSGPNGLGNSNELGNATDQDGAIDEECEFFLWEGGRPVGPVSRTDLRERIANGLLLSDEFVQVGVDGEWQPVEQALNMRRSLLKIPNRSRDNSVNESGHQGLGSPAHSGTQRRSDASVTTTGATRAASRKPSSSADIVPPPIDAKSNAGRAWQHAAVFVGGEHRLRGIVAALVALIAFVVWLRQPPAASTIYREFTQYHRKLAELRTKRTGPTDWKQATSRDQQRVQTLLDGLKQRASAARPVEQQLMWAGRFGLVELFKRPVDPSDFERLYDSHMSQAKRLLEGGITR